MSTTVARHVELAKIWSDLTYTQRRLLRWHCAHPGNGATGSDVRSVKILIDRKLLTCDHWYVNIQPTDLGLSVVQFAELLP